MSKTKLMTAIGVLLLLVMTTACSSPEDSARQTLEQHVMAQEAKNKEALKKTVTKADREVLDAREDKKLSLMPIDMEAVQLAAVEQVSDHYTVELTETKVDGDTMKATAKVSVPVESKEQEKKIKEALLGTIKENKDMGEEALTELVISELTDTLSGMEFETETKTKTYTLKNEDGQWLVSANLAEVKKLEDEIEAARPEPDDKDYAAALEKHAAIAERAAEIDDERLQRKLDNFESNILVRQAADLEWGDKDYAKALANYKRIRELDKARDASSKSMERTEKKIAELEEKLAAKKEADAYREKLVVSDVELQSGMPYVNSMVKNDGDRPVGLLKLKYSFLDDEGNEVLTKEGAVISKFSKQKMKPGGTKEAKFFYGTDIPDSWDEKTIKVSVAEVGFPEKK